MHLLFIENWLLFNDVNAPSAFIKKNFFDCITFKLIEWVVKRPLTNICVSVAAEQKPNNNNKKSFKYHPNTKVNLQQVTTSQQKKTIQSFFRI